MSTSREKQLLIKLRPTNPLRCDANGSFFVLGAQKIVAKWRRNFRASLFYGTLAILALQTARCSNFYCYLLILIAHKKAFIIIYWPACVLWRKQLFLSLEDLWGREKCTTHVDLMSPICSMKNAQLPETRPSAANLN